MFILNRNQDFNKGINKILKMVVMMPETAESISTFIQQRFPVGTLTCTNVMSLLSFLAKVSLIDSPQANQACTILRTLFDLGWFKAQQSNWDSQQIESFKMKLL